MMNKLLFETVVPEDCAARLEYIDIFNRFTLLVSDAFRIIHILSDFHFYVLC